MKLETMKVHNPSGGCMIINETDFNPAIHKKYSEKKEASAVEEKTESPVPEVKKGRPFKSKK